MTPICPLFQMIVIDMKCALKYTMQCDAMQRLHRNAMQCNAIDCKATSKKTTALSVEPPLPEHLPPPLDPGTLFHISEVVLFFVNIA